MSQVKTSFEVIQLRRAGQIAAEIIEALGQMVAPGVSAGELERAAWELCKKNGVVPSFFGHLDYKYATCISVNDEAVHGIPYDEKIFVEGDLVKVDFGVKFNGYCSDHCRTFPVGKISDQHAKLLKTGEAATTAGVAAARVGNRIGDISWGMQSTAEAAGFQVIRMYIGHGIGKKMHELPEVPAFGKPGTGDVLKENMVICVECQVVEGDEAVKHDQDGWTVRTKDGGWSVMFEQMIRITSDGPAEVLSSLV